MMKWVSKKSPLYIFIEDVWEREDDRKIFTPNEALRIWISSDGETVPFGKGAEVIALKQKKNKEQHEFSELFKD